MYRAFVLLCFLVATLACTSSNTDEQKQSSHNFVKDTIPFQILPDSSLPDYLITFDGEKHFTIVLGDSLGIYAEFNDSVWTVYNCEKALHRMLLLMAERLKKQREEFEKKPNSFELITTSLSFP